MVAASTVTTPVASTPSARHSSRASAANASSPTAVSRLISAPSRAAPMAWFEPLPPGPAENAPWPTVSPRSGTRSTRMVMPVP